MLVVDRRVLGVLPRPKLYLGAVLATAFGEGVLLCAQALALATVLAEGFTGTPAAGGIAVLVLVVAGRAAAGWGAEWMVRGAAVAVKAELRSRLFRHSHRLGPAWFATYRTGALTTTAVRGIEALDSYITGYLPQMARAALIPLVVLLWLAAADPLAAVMVLVTLPLIPVFSWADGHASTPSGSGA